MKNNFAIFIVTHKRANNVITYTTLKNLGYTGQIYFIVDNTDPQIQDYQKNFGSENVIVFDKQEWADKTDTIDNFDDMRAVVFARNACFKIAKDLGLEYFCVLDDDYTEFSYRNEKDNRLEGDIQAFNQGKINKLFRIYLQFLIDTKADAVAMAQGGDFLGGTNSSIWKKRILRKVMNSFFFKTDNPVEYKGRINEDVNMYVKLGRQGKVFLTPREAMLKQLPTQQNRGGLTDIYLDKGTYVKSFYTVIISPSSVKISRMGNKYKRIHHWINSNKTYPKIISEKYKK